MHDPPPPTAPPTEPWQSPEATPTPSTAPAMGEQAHAGTAPLQSAEEQKVAEHVRLLGIMAWIYSGLEALGALLGLVYVGLGLYFLSNPSMQPSAQAGHAAASQPSTELFGWIFLGAGVFAVLFSGTLAILTVMSARDLMRHRRRTFCIVIAAIHCINIPLGTVLGIFTIMILNKPEAKALFGRSRA